MLDLSDSYVEFNSSFRIKRNKKKASKLKKCISSITFTWAKEIFRNPCSNLREFHQKIEEKSVISTSFEPYIDSFDVYFKSSNSLNGTLFKLYRGKLSKLFFQVFLKKLFQGMIVVELYFLALFTLGETN